MPGKGPPPEPTALKLLKGTVSRRHDAAKEPQYRAEIPDRPVGMSPGARKFWDEYVGIMAQAAGLLTSADARSLASLCEDQAMLKELRDGMYSLARDMRRDAKEKNKRMLMNPMTIISRTAEGRKTFNTMMQLDAHIANREREFGLMPGSRSRVEVAPGIGPRRMDAIEAALCG